MKNKKMKWVQVFLLCCYFLYLTEMKESHAEEKAKATVGFYEVDKKEQRPSKGLPKTGETGRNKELLISGISILFVIAGMISYRNFKNEERI
ncbi:LPXTG cell wall anchor domain-containing protein [Candidatus Enterococcus mansonii]|nr:LPXTG cell wall anchor domain-containing protein [Enterococcus sp. 4G2_DIV0659]